MPCRAPPVCLGVTLAISSPGDKASTVRNMLVTTSPILRRLVVPSIACNFESTAQAASQRLVEESGHETPALASEPQVLMSKLSIGAWPWSAAVLSGAGCPTHLIGQCKARQSSSHCKH